MNRRTVLAALPAALAAGAVPAVAETETPMRRLYLKWLELYRRANEDSIPQAEADALLERMGELERAIHHTPPRDATDMLMKIGTFTSWGDFEIADCAHGKASIIWAEARALVGM